jgi:hypothetical protein
MEYAYIGYGGLEKLNRPSLWKRLLGRRGVLESLADSKQTAFKLYWWLQIVQAREAGTLPAWEGIRIVREQAPLGEAK